VCATRPPWLDAVAPISYSVAHQQLHHTLASYKRLGGDAGRRLTVALAAVLWRYLDGHEACIARAAGCATAFDIVTSVPPRRSVAAPGVEHPLERLVGRLCSPTRDRYARLLEANQAETGEHEFDRERFAATRDLTGQTVLLVDDTWTTGASAQSAAAALKRGGATAVAAVVIGRHVKREWRENDARLRHTSEPFSWDSCVYCAAPAASDTAAAGGCA
jgi:predicted amidophosphoribosyltransferase